MKNKILCIALFSVAFCINPILTSAQHIPVSEDKKLQGHHEVPDQDYLPYPSGKIRTSTAHKYKTTGIFIVQVNVDANGQNILGDAANEPSISVDPVNPDHMVIGWRQFDNVNSNFRQAGFGYTSDAGQTWIFPGKIEAGVFRSDPVLENDTSGNFYYNSLTSDGVNFSCKVFKSLNGGAGWDDGIEAHGGDKQWMVIDKSGGVGTGNIYSSWTSFYSSCSPGFFTRSTDEGNSFENCISVSGNPYWSTMAVGNEGELYIGGKSEWDGIVVAKSTTAKYPGSSITWDFSSQVDIDGYLYSQAGINPLGLVGQVNIDVDHSQGPGRGNVYVLASAGRLSNVDPADVMFVKSTDGGLTWSTPKRINTDFGVYAYQWFGTMSVAPNGRIDVIWLDTRNATGGNDFSALYYSYSTDQGENWSANEKLSDTFDPHLGYPQQDKMGDYFDMESDNTGAHLAWANTFNGEQDVYYSRIVPQITGIADEMPNRQSFSLSGSPNPFLEETSISYCLPEDGLVTMGIYNIYGKEVVGLINKKQKAGNNTCNFSGGFLPSGFYFCRLSSGVLTETIRLVKIK